MYSIEYAYLRPKKAMHLRHMHESPFPFRRKLSIWEGEKAVILPLRKDETGALLFGIGGVVDNNGNSVALSALPRRIEGVYPFENPEYRDEKVVYCGYLVPQWGHFLVEGVARLWYFLENDPSIDKYVFFLEENAQREIQGNYREFLELLGIWDKLELITRPTAYRQVLVPELGFLCQTYYAPQFLTVFDRVAQNVIPDPAWDAPEKIYFSRSRLKKGADCEFGLDALDNFFSKNGYRVLFPETVSLSRMIHYIRSSQVTATLSGSLQHNMLFARPGQRLEILERCVLNVDFQVDVNRMRELEVTYIDANIPLYTVDFCGPFIMGYNEQLARFAKDRQLLPPDEQFRSKKYWRKCLARYMHAYQDLYRYRWFMADWYTSCADYLWEAYQAGYAFFREYLDGERPFLWHHYLEFHYWKQFVKRLLGIRK